MSGTANASLTGVRSRRAGGDVSGIFAAAGLPASDRAQSADVSTQ